MAQSPNRPAAVHRLRPGEKFVAEVRPTIYTKLETWEMALDRVELQGVVG